MIAVAIFNDDKNVYDSVKSCEPVGPIKGWKEQAGWNTKCVVEVLDWFQETKATHLLWILRSTPQFSDIALKRLYRATKEGGYPLAYGDYQDLAADGSVKAHPLIDYQLGSVRDDFDFGAAVLFNRVAIDLKAEVEKNDLTFGAFYDLRLRLSEIGGFLHLSDPIYRVPILDQRASGKKVFDYVDPRMRDYQIEMEKVATDYLKRIDAYIAPPSSDLETGGSFKVKASVVIPVKNRVKTVVDAVKSALSQKTSFDYNVIVVDNHSDDGTTDRLREIASSDPRLVHLTPKRKDLIIGGCWNEALFSEHCGEYAVQLDSDDIYDGAQVLQRVIDLFSQDKYAMVVGSYTTVDFDLNTLPPGLIDHKEWSDENGQNNALRISGLGAPRAFHVPTLRKIGFPNVGYGEDYAVALRMTRSYKIGRIYDSLYWCRRWDENSDSFLPIDVSNRYSLYKDRLRTIEIRARQKMAGVR